jgi:macrolide transport system ATP-binding/permease protein
LAPAVQSTRPALIPALKGAGYPQPQRRSWRLPLQESLVVGQIVLLMLLLVTGALFVRTLSNLQSVYLGFSHDNLLLFDLNAPRAGRPAATVAAFYDDLRSRFSQMPGVRAVTLSHSSLIRAGRTHPVTVDSVLAQGTRFLQTGPHFFSTMEIPILQGREIDARDRAGASPVAVVSEHFASTFLSGQNPLGRRISVGGAISPLTPSGRLPVEFEIVGVAANARYGNLKASLVPVVYGAYAQIPQSQVQQMTFALRTDGDPLRHAGVVRQIVHDGDPRLPVTNIVTQSGEIDRTINQEIVLARLATAFALLALVIAVAGLYGTMAYAVARRTREIGIRMALGAGRSTMIWMVMRNVGVMTMLGLLISIPVARGSSRFVETFLFDIEPDDPRAFAIALVTLVAAALIGGLGPARRASTIDPVTALRQE